MSGNYKKGFTLIEILIVILIIGVMAAVIAPNFGSKKADQERQTFIAKLNALTQLAWQNALLSHSLHKVVFDFKKKMVSVEQATGEKDSQGNEKFVPLERTYLETSIEWPDYLHIKNFYIEGFDEMKRSVAGETHETWFFVVPGGMTQRVTINATDTHDLQSNGRATKVGLVLNPFNAQFTSYDTFKK